MALCRSVAEGEPAAPVTALLGVAMCAAIAMAACSSNPCSDEHVVQSTLEDTAANRKLASLGVTGGTYDVELDNGHVYAATYGDAPPRVGEIAHLCVEQSKINAERYYSITLDRLNGKIRDAILVK
jgi:hypothetical protein